MWWSRAVLLLAVLALGPAGCGFKPLYGTSQGGVSADVAEILASVRVRAIQDRKGQQLRNALVQRLNPGGEPARARYDLIVKTTTSLEGLGQQKDDRATLGRMLVEATYVVVTPGGGEDGPAVASGRTRSVVSFNYLGARYASVVMERDAEERALDEVAENIRRQLAVHFEKGKASQ
ncbi:MAG: LPS assembly lipoprotein LptE [Pseudomonadota bacterium]